jgi:hypothetical protein
MQLTPHRCVGLGLGAGGVLGAWVGGQVGGRQQRYSSVRLGSVSRQLSVQLSCHRCVGPGVGCWSHRCEGGWVGVADWVSRSYRINA